MKKIAFILLIILVSTFFLIGNAISADNDNHTVTVTVSAVNEVAISGGNITLTINSATAGSDLTDATDSTTCDLDWTTNESSKKITVATDQGSPDYTLKVVAANVSGGAAASEVTLSTTATDFVTAIGTTIGGCDLNYTAEATVSDGTGSNVHTVTYTLTAS